ncbi:hypothetical protein MPLB_1490098 [Mesorhizobium sp. ORS 3324]|nr:hypothetical protein MPLB_1490098 [Mesorhizobium sp. ORS 3324]
MRVLSALFRRLFLQALQSAFTVDQLRLSGELADLVDPSDFAHRIAELKRASGVAYSKPPFWQT